MKLKARSEKPFVTTWVGRFRHDRSVRMHEHAETELVLVVANECVFEVNGAFLSAAPGEVAVLPARVPHAQWSEGMTETRYCLFRCGSFGFSEEFRVVKPGEDRYICGWFADLVSLFDQPAESPSVVADALLEALVERLRRIEKRGSDEEPLYPAVSAALDRMKVSLNRDLAIQELAESAGVSESHLRALFKKSLGKSPHQCLQELRLKAARDFLRDPYLNISEVAYRSGFRDPNYFIRVFREAHAVSPGKWRAEKH